MSGCGLKDNQRAEVLLNHLSAGSKAHFDSCPSCHHASQKHAALWQTLDAWSVPGVSSGFNRELYARIDAAAAAPWYERWAAAIRPVFAQPTLAMALATVLIGGGFALDHTIVSSAPSQSARPSIAGVHSPGTSAVQVSTTEAEQVEKTLDDLEMLRQFDLAGEEKDNTSKSM